jgi:hypothetical protein
MAKVYEPATAMTMSITKPTMTPDECWGCISLHLTVLFTKAHGAGRLSRNNAVKKGERARGLCSADNRLQRSRLGGAMEMQRVPMPWLIL